MQNNILTKAIFVAVLLGSSQLLMAQNEGSGGEVLTYAIVAIIGLLILGSILMVSENLLQIESRRLGVEDKVEGGGSIYPRASFFTGKMDKKLKGKRVHVLKDGFDISLVGQAEYSGEIPFIHSDRYALQPKDFRGIAPIPKVKIETGTEVLAGDPVFYDKTHPDVNFVAPVSGEYIELVRGEKRSINELVILADKEVRHREFTAPSDDADREEIIEYLKKTGGWVHINKRPFDVIPDPEVVPRDIFISTFDTAPLAPEARLLVDGCDEDIQKAFDVLNKLTDGKIYLGMNGNDVDSNPRAFTKAKGVERHYFKGKHPAGNVGVQMHHIKPIKKGDSVWTIKIQDLITIGRLFTQGIYSAERVVAITGEDAQNPTYVRTHAGVNLNNLLKNQMTGSVEETRIISGNVLSGKTKSLDDAYFGTFDNQITLIPEGDYYEPFGWLVPQSLRPTVSHTYPNFILPDMKYHADTNTHGEKRAFVVTGQYEELLPMDIYLQHLMKAIIMDDFERMEGLGIFELSEEDVALCEFACTSKMPLQNILRDGLNTYAEQS